MQIGKILDSSKKKLGLIALLVIIIGSFILRVINIESLPLGLSASETNLATQASIYLDKGWGEIDHNLDNNLIPVSWDIVVISLMIKIFGFSVLALRIPSVILSIISIFFLYLWLNKTYSKQIAIFGAFIMASLPWNLYLARGGGIKDNALIFLIILSEWLISKIKTKPNKRYFILLGLTIGLGFYSNSGFYLWALLRLGMLIKNLVQRKLNNSGYNYLITLIISVIMFLPIFINQLSHKFISLKNITNKLVFDDNSMSIGTKFLRPIKELKILSFNGDPNPLHGLAYQPLINGFLALMLLLGVLFVITKYKDKNYRYPLLAVLILFLPNILLSDSDLNSFRIAGALPFIVLLIAIGVDYFLINWKNQVSKNHLAQRIGYLLIISLLILSAIENTRLYFLAYAQDIPVYQAYREESISITNFLNDNISTKENTILIADNRALGSINYLTHGSSSYQIVDYDALNNIPNDPRPRHIIFSTYQRSDSEINKLLTTIKEKFPESISQGKTGKYSPEILYYIIVI